MLKKSLTVLLVLFLVSISGAGCSLGSNPEEKYENSFLKIWNQLTAKQQSLEKKEAQKRDNIDELIDVYKEGSENHKEAKKQLTKLSPPSKFKRLHSLTLAFIDAGIEYFDQLTKIAEETRGNYTEEQEQLLDGLHRKWQHASTAAQNEAKELGWEVK